MKRSLYVLFLSTLCLPLSAQEHPACRDTGFPYVHETAASLRRIAASCDTTAASDLFYNRAYYSELLADFETLAILTTASGSGPTRRQFERYRIYMPLVEAFSAVAASTDAQRIKLLNDRYDVVLEIVELRLKGYERRAQVLESSQLHIR